MKLTQEQKRVKIAEAHGWKFGTYSADGPCGQGWLKPGETRKSAKSLGDCIAWSARELPDYFNDLDATAKIRKTLTGESKLAFIARLNDVMRASGIKCSLRDMTEVASCSPICGMVFDYVDAAAELQAEAFGLTLSLWEVGE
jgi:hypothetical protein